MDLFNAISALGAAGAAVAAWQSARTTERTAYASLLAGLVGEYGSERMHRDLEILSHVAAKRDFPQGWRDSLELTDRDLRDYPELQDSKDEGTRANVARRNVKQFFFRVAWLCQDGLLPVELGQRVFSFAGATLLFEAVEPMEREAGMMSERTRANLDYIRETFDLPE